MATLDHAPVVKTEMLIHSPVEEVFEAFIDPEITTKFWFTKSSGRLEEGKRVRWEWEMYGVSDDILVKEIKQKRLIRIESSDSTLTEWEFTPQTETKHLSRSPIQVLQAAEMIWSTILSIQWGVTRWCFVR